MNGEKPSGFKFRLDEVSPDRLLQNDFDPQGLKKLSGRLTRVMIILPCLVALAMGWIYYDLSKGVSRLSTLDVDRMQSLSQDINSKFSSLSLQFAKLQESVQTLQGAFQQLQGSFQKKVLPMDEIFLMFENTTSAMKQDLNKALKAIDEIKAAKSDKSEIAAAVDKLEKQIAPVYPHLKNMESEIKALDENLTQEVAELSGNYHKIRGELAQFEKLKKEISTLSAAKPDMTRIEAAIKTQEAQFDKTLKKIQDDLKGNQETLKTLEGQIQELMKFKALSEIKKRLEPMESSPPGSPSSPPSPSGQAGRPGPPPGKITEEILR